MQKRFKIEIQILAEALLLLAVTLGILANFSHMALRQEALSDAEQTLEGTVQDIDNILLSVEQSTYNIYYDMLGHLNDPDRMYTYSRKLVESNPNIDGCAIAFKPNYYPDKELFMAYVHHRSLNNENNSVLETSETFTDRPYTEQRWYSEPFKTGRVGWTDPLKGSDTEDKPLVTFCMPITDKDNERIGVIGVDVSISHLSKIIQTAKPSANGYSVLLAHNGSYIVHPDNEKLTNPEIYSQKKRDVDPSELEVAQAMVNGKSGMKEFVRGNHAWCVFFKPFERSEWEGSPNGNIGWSVGVVYPEEDIFGVHNILLWQVLAIAILGMLLFFVLCKWILQRQLKPMKRLVVSAKHIAKGNYNEALPYSDRQDEIGLLQNRFEQMQQSLQNQVNELKEETLQLQQRGDMLQAAYDKTIEVDSMKTSFLNYMTSQMSVQTEDIDKYVTTLCNDYKFMSDRDKDRQVENIQRNTQSIIELLGHMAHFTEKEEETGKEAANA